MKKQEKKLDKKLQSGAVLDSIRDRFILLLVLSFLLSVEYTYPFSTNGTEKTFDFAVTSGKNNDVLSSNFRTYSVVADITSVVNSSNFRAEIGFMRTLPYLDGESCSINLECVGGFCCSNICRSSSCPEPQPSAAPSAAAGGGGGGVVPIVVFDFELEIEYLKALIKQGQTIKTKFSVKNTGTEELSIKVDYSKLKDMVLLSETEFALAPGKVKEIDVTIFAGEEKKPDVYTGNIKVTARDIVKTLPVIIEVQSKKALFDIAVKVLPEYKNILRNETVFANITLINVGDLKPADAQLFYSIRDLEGNDLAFGVETLAIYNEVHRIKELELPLNISIGTYLFYGKVSYGAGSAAAGDVFYVVAEKPATCFDRIQNQNEEGTDCGGVCKPCEKPIGFFKWIFALILGYWIYLLILLILIILIIILMIMLKRREDEKRLRLLVQKNMHKLIMFINLALHKGHKAEQIRAKLIQKGLQKDFVERMIKYVIYRNRILGEYIQNALRLGHYPVTIKRMLLNVGWREAEIDTHMLNAIDRINEYKR